MIGDCPDDPSRIDVRGPDGAWRAEHRTSRVDGPLAVWIGERQVIRGCRTAFGAMADSAALAEDVRSNQKANVTVVTARGRFPFGAEIGLIHTFRYGASFVRTTTDLTLPGGATVGDHVQVGSLTLGTGWTRYAVVAPNADGTAARGPWQSLAPDGDGVCARWPQPPLAVVLTDGAGMELELGTGQDLWRWQAGLLEAGNRGETLLQVTDDATELVRVVSVVGDEAQPRARKYRFSFYLAWRSGNRRDDCDGPWGVAEWRPGGDLEPMSVAKLADAGVGVVVDLNTMPSPTGLRREWGKATPAPLCLAANAVSSRLKRAVRQLRALTPPDLPVRFAGLRPGACRRGSHVQRNGDRSHWDMAALLEFSLWARQTLGRQRPIRHDATDLDTPATAALFRGLDHGAREGG